MENQNQTNRKLIIVIIALAVVIVGMIIAGIVLLNKNKPSGDEITDDNEPAVTSSIDETDAKDSKDTKAEEKPEATPTPEAEKEEAVVNPLADLEVSYPGSKKAEDPETAKLLQFFVENEPDINKEDIIVATVDDFDCDGDYEAFLFVGDFYSDEYEEYYVGNMWFTNGEKNQDLGESSTGSWWTVDGTMNFDGRKYVYATIYYTTGGLSKVWSVYDDMASVAEIDCLGSVTSAENNDIIITYDTYDTCLDSDTYYMIGHSWKPYYFYYDKKLDQIIEYGGAFVREDQIDKICGIDLVEQIHAQYPDVEITTAFYRENGVLNVNFREVNGKGDVNFSNANYNVKKGEFINAWSDSPTSDIKQTNYGGMYVSCLSALSSTYPEVEKKTESYDLAVTSFNNLAESTGCIMISGRINDMSSSWKSYLVDNNTRLEFTVNDANVRAFDWFTDMMIQERDGGSQIVECVYIITVTNGHVDSISGVYAPW